MLRIAGISLHQGKTRVWNPAGVVAEVGQEAWQPDGITVLGTPIRKHAVHRWKRGSRGKECWERQSSLFLTSNGAWQILLQSANPRANHSTRTLPPTLSAEYCHAHDEGI